MSDAQRFAKIDGQHVDLLPALRFNEIEDQQVELLPARNTMILFEIIDFFAVALGLE